MREVVLCLVSDEFLHQVMLPISLSGLRSHDCGFEPQPQAYCDAIIDGRAQRSSVIGIVKLRQETEGSKSKRQYRRYDPLEKPAGVE